MHHISQGVYEVTVLFDLKTAYTIPILAFAFVCHPEVLPIYTELSKYDAHFLIFTYSVHEKTFMPVRVKREYSLVHTLPCLLKVQELMMLKIEIIFSSHLGSNLCGFVPSEADGKIAFIYVYNIFK